MIYMRGSLFLRPENVGQITTIFLFTFKFSKYYVEITLRLAII